eukprot:762416-Amphidinium_carterae.1
MRSLQHRSTSRRLAFSIVSAQLMVMNAGGVLVLYYNVLDTASVKHASVGEAVRKMYNAGR